MGTLSIFIAYGAYALYKIWDLKVGKLSCLSVYSGAGPFVGHWTICAWGRFIY